MASLKAPIAKENLTADEAKALKEMALKFM